MKISMQPQINSNNKKSFKGLEQIGTKLSKPCKALKLNNLIEFNGLSMPFNVLAANCFGAVLIPRIIMAQSPSDREEIIRRDTLTIGTLLFGGAFLGKTFSRMCEKVSGFALVVKDHTSSKLKNIWNYLRPVKGHQVLSSGKIESIYSNVDKSKNGILDLFDFVVKQGGSLKKIFSSDAQVKQQMEKALGQTMDGIKDNKSFIDAAKQRLQNAGGEFKDLYTTLAKKNNPLVNKAKLMNSTFGFISTFILVPFCLGYLILKINESITKSKIKKAQAKNTQVQAPNINLIWATKYSPLNFKSLKK